MRIEDISDADRTEAGQALLACLSMSGKNSPGTPAPVPRTFPSLIMQALSKQDQASQHERLSCSPNLFRNVELLADAIIQRSHADDRSVDPLDLEDTLPIEVMRNAQNAYAVDLCLRRPLLIDEVTTALDKSVLVAIRELQSETGDTVIASHRRDAALVPMPIPKNGSHLLASFSADPRPEKCDRLTGPVVRCTMDLPEDCTWRSLYEGLSDGDFTLDAKACSTPTMGHDIPISTSAAIDWDIAYGAGKDEDRLLTDAQIDDIADGKVIRAHGMDFRASGYDDVCATLDVAMHAVDFEVHLIEASSHLANYLIMGETEGLDEADLAEGEQLCKEFGHCASALSVLDQEFSVDPHTGVSGNLSTYVFHTHTEEPPPAPAKRPSASSPSP